MADILLNIPLLTSLKLTKYGSRLSEVFVVESWIVVHLFCHNDSEFGYCDISAYTE